MNATATPTREALVASFRTQPRGCAQTGSPIYAELLTRAADDLEAGGVFADVLAEYRGEPVLDALPLRVLGAVHERVLSDAGAPLAWLRMEGTRLDDAELRLTLWPGGEDRLLAHVHWHGAWVRWSG